MYTTLCAGCSVRFPPPLHLTPTPPPPPDAVAPHREKKKMCRNGCFQCHRVLVKRSEASVLVLSIH